MIYLFDLSDLVGFKADHVEMEMEMEMAPSTAPLRVFLSLRASAAGDELAPGAV